MYEFDINLFSTRSIRFKFACNECGATVMSDEIYPPQPNYYAEKARDSENDVTETSYCENCNKEFEITIYSGYNGGSVQIDGLSSDDEVEPIILDDFEEEDLSSFIISNTDFYDTYLRSVEKIQALLQAEMPPTIQLSIQQIGLPGSNNIILRQYLHNLLYINAITALETYLSDAFINTVIREPKLVRKFVETTPYFKNQKVSLSNLFQKWERMDDEVKKYLSLRLWHKLSEIKLMYKDTLGINFPESVKEILKAIAIRHDLVHRNGRTKNGDEITITEDDVRKLLEQTITFVNHINTGIASIEI